MSVWVAITVLATVLFTDLVGSTERQAALGDRAWKSLAERHHALIREALTRWRGVENDTASDGFYATFDGPARAIRYALEIARLYERNWSSTSVPADMPENAN